jgi:hypothetical protein
MFERASWFQCFPGNEPAHLLALKPGALYHTVPASGKAILSMTKHSRYPAYSSIVETPRSTVDPLVQHYVYGTVSRDTILLLPMLSSSTSRDEPSPCLHPVHQSDSSLAFCNTWTEHRCPCCGTSMCYEHESKRANPLPDETGQEETSLCTTCASFSIDTIYTLYTFRCLINEWEGRG